MNIKKSHVSIGVLILIISLIVVGTLNQSSKPQFKLETPKSSAGEIIVITPENKTYTESDSGYYPATYGFENDKDGANPSDWTLFGSGGATLIISDIGAHSKVLELHDTSGAGYLAAEQRFETNHDINGDTIEFWWRTTNSINTGGVTLFDNGKTGYLTEVRIWDGYFKFFNGTDWQDFISCSNNRWYHHKIVIDFTNKEFDWVIDNTIEQAGITFMNTTVTNFRSIYVGTSYTQSSYDHYFDAIGYSWDSNYNIGDNLNEGLLLSYENSTNLDWKGYSLDDQANRTILGNTTIPMPVDGLHTIQVFGNDSVGTMYESNLRYFTTNALGPDITINSPISNHLYGTTPPDFSLSIADSDLDASWYSLDGGTTNIPFSGLTGTIDKTEWDKIGNGTVTLTFYANDTANNIDQEEVTVRKDIIAPVITINSPTLAEEFDYTPIYGITIDEANMDEFWYTIDNGANNYTISSLTGTINNVAWDAASEGPVTIQFYAKDEAGNIGTNFILVVKIIPEVPTPPGIPGYNLIALLGVTLSITLILAKRKQKK